MVCLYVWRHSCIRVTCETCLLALEVHMTEWPDSFICATWRILMCDMTHVSRRVQTSKWWLAWSNRWRDFSGILKFRVQDMTPSYGCVSFLNGKKQRFYDDDEKIYTLAHTRIHAVAHMHSHMFMHPQTWMCMCTTICTRTSARSLQ